MRTAAPRGGRAHDSRTRLSIVSIVLEGIESRGCARSGHGARRNTESKTRSIGRGHDTSKDEQETYFLLSLTEFFGHNRNENLVHRLFPGSALRLLLRKVVALSTRQVTKVSF